jgi:hypothetical protein
MEKHFSVLVVRMELIITKVLPGMLLLRLAKLMNLPSHDAAIAYCIVQVLLYARLRHAGSKDDLN